MRSQCGCRCLRPAVRPPDLAVAVGRAGGILTALDVAESRPDHLLVDVTFDASNADHADAVVAAIETLDGVKVLKVSDRTFLLHLGGKLEVVSKVPLKHRDDLSRAYTPGVARVCLAIAKHPDDVRRLTIKHNTVAVVTDGSAVLGLGDIGPLTRTCVTLLFGLFIWLLLVRERTDKDGAAAGRPRGAGASGSSVQRPQDRPGERRRGLLEPCRGPCERSRPPGDDGPGNRDDRGCGSPRPAARRRLGRTARRSPVARAYHE